MSDQLQAATTSLEQSGFLKSPTINGLLGYLLVQTCLVREEEPLGSCAFIGTAMRVGKLLYFLISSSFVAALLLCALPSFVSS